MRGNIGELLQLSIGRGQLLVGPGEFGCASLHQFFEVCLVFLKLLLRSPAVGYIARNAHATDDVAVSITQRHLRRGSPALAAIWPRLLLLFRNDWRPRVNNVLFVLK